MKNLRSGTVAALVANAAYIMEFSAFTVILPFIGAELHLTEVEMGRLYTVYALSLCAMLFVGGELGDLFSLSYAFLMGLFLFIIGGFTLVFSTDYDQMLVARILQGAGAGLFSPAVTVLIANDEEMSSSKALTTWGFISGVVAAATPFLFSMISDYITWGLAWSLVPIIAILPFLFLRQSVRETRYQGSAKNFRLNIRLLIICFYVFFIYGLTIWYQFAFPQLSPKVFDLSSLGVGILVTLLWIGFSITCYLMKFATSKRALLLYLYCSPLAVVSGILLLVFGDGIGIALLSVLLVGFGMGLGDMPTTKLVLDYSDNASQGIAASLVILCARLGGAIAVAVIPLDATYLSWFPIALGACLGILVLVDHCLEPKLDN